MNLLLDTHSFLWFVLSDSRLSGVVRAAIGDPNNTVHLSPASYWEIAIKVRIGKYALPGPYAPFIHQELARNRFVILDITIDHTAVVATLPLHHRDPFDRLLIAQSLVERYPLISGDQLFDQYGITRLW